jgi:capsule polysaccharide export protein KpsE/RkpR
MAKPDDRVPLGALNVQLKTVRKRMADAAEKVERLTAREADLLTAIAAERAAVQAELDAATAELEGDV